MVDSDRSSQAGPVHDRATISATVDPARRPAIKRHLYRLTILVGRMVIALACVRMAMLLFPPWAPLFNYYVLAVLSLGASLWLNTVGAPRLKKSTETPR